MTLAARCAALAALSIQVLACSASSERDSAPSGAANERGTPTSSGSGSGGASSDPGGNVGASTGYTPGGGTGGASYSGSGGTAAPGAISVEPPVVPPSNQGDSYEGVGTNPFVVAAHDPLSTFAADVDTASYDIFRRDVEAGMLPIAASVRLEEYVNSFTYDYPAPAETDEHPFSISLAAAPHLFSRGTTLVRVGIQAQAPAAFEKKPANLVFLIDTSGSMASAAKLPLVQHTLTQTLELLEPTDTVSIVTYAGSTGVRLEPTPVAEYDVIADAINGLTSAGSTAGASGIQLAYAQAEAGFLEGGINHVILCTDGDFNVGPSSTEELVELITEKRQSGITLTVLGYGTGNLNDAMMEAISNKGNGVYGVISSEEHAERYVRERMLSTLQLIAKDMKIQVEFNPAQVYAYRLLGYENRDIADDDFRDDAIDAGEVGAGHRVTALYEVILAGGEIPMFDGAPAAQDGALFDGTPEVDAGDLVLVKVRYKDLDATESDAAYEVASSLSPDAVLPAFEAADLDLQWAIAVAAYAEILKQSPYAELGHLDIIGQIAAAQAERDADRAEFASLFDKALPLLAGSN